MRDHTAPATLALRTSPTAAAAPTRSARVDARPATGISREMVHRACRGDRDAQESVFRQYVPPLSRMASVLLPGHLRGVTDSQDLVQDVLARTTRHLEHIDCVEDGALLAYLRRAVRHRIVDEIRRVSRRPTMSVLMEEWPTSAQSPLDAAIQAQNNRRLRAAMCRLSSRDRLAILLRLQRDLTYEEIAGRLRFPTANAARVAVRRAAVRLGELLEPGAMPGRLRSHARRRPCRVLQVPD